MKRITVSADIIIAGDFSGQDEEYEAIMAVEQMINNPKRAPRLDNGKKFIPRIHIKTDGKDESTKMRNAA